MLFFLPLVPAPLTTKGVTKSFSDNEFSLKQLAKEIVWIYINWKSGLTSTQVALAGIDLT